MEIDGKSVLPPGRQKQTDGNRPPGGGVVRRTKNGDELIGRSEAMAEVFEAIGRYARVDATVCIMGETGVGKNLAAQLIHDSSRRRARPFVKLDCTHIGSDLWESECMGSCGGAYTGATNRIGLFKSADGGTLFIDEVQDMSWAHQGKLRDFLDSRTVRPVGATRGQRLDLRIILGMNQNPRQMVREGQFRTDLFRRLGRNVIRIAPLRQRKEDVPDLAHYVVRKTCRENGLTCKELTSGALRLLQEYDWPWNVGELHSVVENAVLCSDDGTIDAEHIGESLTAWARIDGEPVVSLNSNASLIAKVQQQGLPGTVEEFERHLIGLLLDLNEGRQRYTASALGIAPTTLRDKMKKYGLPMKSRSQ